MVVVIYKTQVWKLKLEVKIRENVINKWKVNSIIFSNIFSIKKGSIYQGTYLLGCST